MKIAVIPAYNEEITIGSIVILCRLHVDRVIVVDDGSSDNTTDVAREAGAEVIRIPSTIGYGGALSRGLSRAIGLDPDSIVTIDGDGYHNPKHILEILAPIEDGRADIVLIDRITNFRAYGRNAFSVLVISHPDMDAGLQILTEASRLRLRIEKISIGAEERIEQLPFRMLEKLFVNVLKEHSLDRIRRLTTAKEIFDEKRRIQKKQSMTESYRLLCETFLKFIPPALLSLIISLIILVPSTGYDIETETAAILMGAVLSIFLVAWLVLVRLLDSLYEKQAYIDMLNARDTEIRQVKRDEMGYSRRPIL